MSQDGWVTVTEADQVTEEILTAAEEIFTGWYARTNRIDWPEFLDRLDGQDFASLGGMLDLGNSLDTPAITKIKAHITAYRRLTA